MFHPRQNWGGVTRTAGMTTQGSCCAAARIAEIEVNVVKLRTSTYTLSLWRAAQPTRERVLFLCLVVHPHRPPRRWMIGILLLLRVRHTRQTVRVRLH